MWQKIQNLIFKSFILNYKLPKNGKLLQVKKHFYLGNFEILFHTAINILAVHCSKNLVVCKK